MSNSDSILIICITLLFTLFWGDPDLHDALVNLIGRCEVDHAVHR